MSKYSHSHEFLKLCDRIFSDVHSHGHDGTHLFLRDSLFFSHDFMASLVYELEEKYWATSTELTPLEMLGVYVLASSAWLKPKEFDVLNVIDHGLLDKLCQIAYFINMNEVEDLDTAQELIRQVRSDYGDFTEIVGLQAHVEMANFLADEMEDEEDG